jgi:hypothetical protein
MWPLCSRIVVRAAALLLAVAPVRAPAQFVRVSEGRVHVVSHPDDSVLARRLLRSATQRDTFPDLPRPHASVLVMLAPDSATFRQWVGPGVPEWGAAIAIPAQSRVVMQAQARGSVRELHRLLRHELAHLALHEAIGDLPPRWFDEGYASVAADEWNRESFVAANAALIARRIPGYDGLDSAFETRSALGAQAAYALSHRAVVELARLDRTNGLARLFPAWREMGRLDPAVRRAYGVTLATAEARYRTSTRWRVAFLAFGVDSSLVMLLIMAPLLPLYRRRRREQRERLARMREHELRLEHVQHTRAIEQFLAVHPLDHTSEDR